MFDRKECKRKAREALKGKYKAPVLVGLVNYVLILAFYAVYFKALISVQRNEIPVYNVILIAICCAVVAPAFIFAYKRTICDFLRGKEISIKTFFGEFKYIKKAQGLFWWTYLQLFWRMLVAALVITLVVVILSFLAKGASFFLILTKVVMFVLMIALYVYMFRVLYAFSMNLYICANDTSVGCIDATRYSVKVTKNNIGKVFVMDLSFIGWILLSYLTLGILMLWIMPYFEATRFYALEQLSEDANKTEGEAKTAETSAPVNQ